MGVPGHTLHTHFCQACFVLSLQYKSEEVHGTSGLGYKNQDRTVYKDALKTIHPLNKNENQRSISILTLKFVSNMVEITFEFVRPLFQIVNCP